MTNLIKSNHNLYRTQEELNNIIEKATEKYGEFLTALGFDWKNDIQMQGTPNRVAKMYVTDIFNGCYAQEPNITTFDNVDDSVDSVSAYDGMVFNGNIRVQSACSHHIIPFLGVAHVAYIPKKGSKVIGLSKLNRIVEFFCRRPQIQENLTMQIHDYICKILPDNDGVAVVIKADHLCVKMRGVKHDSTMITNKLSGAFMDVHGAVRNEFYNNIEFLRK